MIAKFTDVFSDETKHGKKIQTSDYLKLGEYPIIDQGQDQIAGYTNEKDGVFTEVPVIIFGDHTRIIKYIDTPFFLGADGVKLLKCKINNTDYKYLYYYLQSIKIPNTGYNRHFKWLKESNIFLPSLDEQRHIAAVLDKVSDLIAKRKQQLDKLDEMTKAKFVEMFGAYTETVRLSDVSTISGGLTKSTKRDKLPLRMPYLRVANVSFASIDVSEMLDIGLTNEEYSKTLLQSGDLLFVEGNGSPDQIGRVAIWENQVVPCVHQNHLIKSRFNKGLVNPSFAMYYFMSPKGREQIKGKAVSTSGLYTLSVSKISDLMLPTPPLDLQNQFAAFVTQTDKSKLTIQHSLDKLEVLKKALMQQYFTEV